MKSKNGWDLTLTSLALLSASACIHAPGEDFASAPDRDLVLPDGVLAVRTLQQNWSDVEAAEFYGTPQGSKLMPYTWFLNLEQADSEVLFRDTENIRKIGYLPRKANPKGNPDGLPVGFVRDDDHLGLTCAACHTGELRFGQTSWLIDGGPTLADAGALLRGIENSLRQTHDDAAKFERFGNGVLGRGASADVRAELKTELAKVLEQRAGYNQRGLPQAGAPQFGPGRIDAFGQIMNEVAVRFAQVPDNPTKIDAPVSLPMLWDTPQHDKVQWNGAAPNTIDPAGELLLGTKHIGALGRNVGEVIGVFGDVETTQDRGNLAGYPSTVKRDNLIRLEEILTKLWSPQWPEDTFGAIDPALRDQGRALYLENCVSCHARIDRTDPNRKIVANLTAVGTDPVMAENFLVRQAKGGVFTGRTTLLDFPQVRVEQAEGPLANLLEHLARRSVFGVGKVSAGLERLQSVRYEAEAEIRSGDKVLFDGVFSRIEVIGGKLARFEARTLHVLDGGLSVTAAVKADLLRVSQRLRDRFSLKHSADASAEAAVANTIQGAAAPADDVRVVFKYKARPLNGIWASPPYLHNGSVANLDDLLKPAAQRQPFRVGSREFDPVKVGYRSDVGEFEFDTSSRGNSNAGHEYGSRVFTAEERRQLIEFMKSL